MDKKAGKTGNVVMSDTQDIHRKHVRLDALLLVNVLSSTALNF